MSLPVVRNPNWSGQPVIIGGIELLTTSATQESGVDAPTKSMEKGAEISQRNVQHPESGTISGAVDGSGLSGLHSLVQQRDPISITTPEGTVQKCVVQNVSRTREGHHVSKFGVEVEWRQVLTAELGSVTIQAVTPDGKKSSGSGSSSPISLAGSKSTSTSSGASSSTGPLLGSLVPEVAAYSHQVGEDLYNHVTGGGS